MKLPLVASILLASAYGSVWPYHEASGVFVPPAYVRLDTPEVNLHPVKATKEPLTIVAGPTSGPTIIKGASAAPVTIVSSSESAVQVSENNLHPIQRTKVTANIPESSVLIKGASSGPVTLIAPYDAPTVSVIGSDNGSSSKASVTITSDRSILEDIGKPGSVMVTGKESVKTIANATASTTLDAITGVASATAVIGPSTGPIVIAGPTAVPVTVATTPTVTPLTVTETTTAPVTVTESTTALVAASDSTTSTVSTDSTISNNAASSSATISRTVSKSATIESTESDSIHVKGTNGRSTVVESSVSSSASVRQDSKNSVFASAKVDLIPSIPVVTVATAPISGIVVSGSATPYTLVSGPSGSISTVDTSTLLVEKPIHSLLRKW